MHRRAPHLHHRAAVGLLVVARADHEHLALHAHQPAGEGERRAPLPRAGLGREPAHALLAVVVGLRHRRVGLVRARRRGALVLVVDVRRGIELALEAARPVQRRRAPQLVDLAHLVGDLDLRLGRDLLRDQAHREDRRQVVGARGRSVGAQRRRGLAGQVRHQVHPVGRDLRLGEQDLGVVRPSLLRCVGRVPQRTLARARGGAQERRDLAQRDALVGADALRPHGGPACADRVEGDGGQARAVEVADVLGRAERAAGRAQRRAARGRRPRRRRRAGSTRPSPCRPGTGVPGGDRPRRRRARPARPAARRRTEPPKRAPRPVTAARTRQPAPSQSVQASSASRSGIGHEHGTRRRGSAMRARSRSIVSMVCAARKRVPPAGSTATRSDAGLGALAPARRGSRGGR